MSAFVGAARAAWCAAALLLAACGSGAGGGDGQSAASIVAPAAPLAADVTILFMGNSHTAFHDVPGTVVKLMRGAEPSRTVAALTSPDWMHLDERGEHEPSLALLRSQRWTFVVLQAQNYSSSGQFVYSTAGAEKLVRIAREQGALPVLFAEWPRRGIAETGRIVQTYASIARVTPACLPPIPQAFDIAALRHPWLVLHDSDGNHSAPAGAFLAALLLHATLAAKPPESAPVVDVAGVDGDTQRLLREVARDAAAITPARSYCTNG